MSDDGRSETTETVAEPPPGYTAGERAAAGLALIVVAALSLMALDVLLGGRLTGGRDDRS